MKSQSLPIKFKLFKGLKKYNPNHYMISINQYCLCFQTRQSNRLDLLSHLRQLKCLWQNSFHDFGHKGKRNEPWERVFPAHCLEFPWCSHGKGTQDQRTSWVTKMETQVPKVAKQNTREERDTDGIVWDLVFQSCLPLCLLIGEFNLLSFKATAGKAISFLPFIFFLCHIFWFLNFTV